MKKAAVLLAAGLCLCACACAPHSSVDPSVSQTQKPVEIEIWTYPVGGWGNSQTVTPLLTAFHRDNPNIRVSVKYVDYNTGDEKIKEAIQTGATPDLILEGPERLVADWGARGLMADLGDLWQDGVSKQIYEKVSMACHDREGNYYIYPLCMTTHCMAINRDLFEAADAWQYVDEETHTWTTENFVKAVAALREYGMETVGAVYCGRQGGDQGTRALVNNLYSGTFTDPEHTKYTLDSSENIRALELLKSMEGISFDETLVGSSEIQKFIQGDLAMAFCWNVFQEYDQLMINPGLEFDIFPMAFPTDDGEVNLQGGIWGFGMFAGKDEKRVEASKTLIRYLTQDEKMYPRAVQASTYWPVRDIEDPYVNDATMNEYGIFRQYFGDYYQITPGWAEARTAWWQMLQKIGRGAEVYEAVSEFSEKVNSNR